MIMYAYMQIYMIYIYMQTLICSAQAGSIFGKGLLPGVLGLLEETERRGYMDLHGHTASEVHPSLPPLSLARSRPLSRSLALSLALSRSLTLSLSRSRARALSLSLSTHTQWASHIGPFMLVVKIRNCSVRRHVIDLLEETERRGYMDLHGHSASEVRSNLDGVCRKSAANLYFQIWNLRGRDPLI